MQHNKIKQVITGVTLLLAGLFVGGCASIVHGGSRLVKIATEPAGAKASISTKEGEVVTVQTTPCTVLLDQKRGYFKGQSFILKLELDGYKTAEVELNSSLSGWYFGNIVFGGLIGMVVVDPLTGAMWNIEPSEIKQTLTPQQAKLIKEKNGFVVVLVSEVTESERKHMTRIN
jgi:hypothetical protein